MTIEDPAEKGFATDRDDPDEPIGADEHDAHALTPDALAPEALPEAMQSATVVAPREVAQPATHAPDLSVLDVRPGPGRPRDYHFPRFERFQLSNGLTVVNAHVAGRALVAAQLLLPGGGWTESPEQAGVTVLTARAMTEGTQRRDANDFVESSERLGAEIHADATWEALTASVEVPRRRFGDALALLAEMVAQPAFPGDEVERLRDERMNDLLQAMVRPAPPVGACLPGDDLRRRSAIPSPAGGYPVERDQARSRCTWPRVTRRSSIPRRQRSSLPATWAGFPWPKLPSATWVRWRPPRQMPTRQPTKLRADRPAGASCSWTGPARLSRRCASATWASAA